MIARHGTSWRSALRIMGLISVASVISSLTARSQQRDMMREEPEERPPFFFYEPVNLIAGDSSLSRLDIPYRIDQSFFIAVRNKDSSSQWQFVSRGELLIELFDSLEVSRARAIQSVEIGTDRPDREQPGKRWYQGIASFTVPPGRYKIVFEVDDLESERKYVDNRTVVRLKRFSAAAREMSTPLFIKWKAEHASALSLRPVNLGPHILFGDQAAILVEMPLSPDTTAGLRVTYSISTSSTINRRAATVIAETLSHPLAVPRINLACVPGNDTAMYAVASTDSTYALGLIIPIASEKLLLRRYDLTLTVTSGSMEFKATKSFQTVWPDMPFSLRDVDYAITALKYITNDDQRDSLRRGDFEDRRDKLEAFWKAKDNTPATAYNEVMVEYYRRVDYASKNFGTLREPDGFKSDRGRIYILYGPPTKTDRTLSPTAGFGEVWTYEKLGKKFIFSDQTKSGNYILTSTQPL